MTLIAAHLNAGVIPVVTVQRQVYISLSPHLHTPFLQFYPSLMVSVDVRHPAYLPCPWSLLGPACGKDGCCSKSCAALANHRADRQWARAYTNRASYTMADRARYQSSGAVWKSRWPSWVSVPNKPTVSVDVKQHSTNARSSRRDSEN